jgi:hypothetical protein
MPLRIFKDCESDIMNRLAKYLLIMLCVVAEVSVCNGQNSASSNEASPTNCEQNSATIDQTRSLSRESLVIAVARLGTGETSRSWNRRRLYNLGTYWKEHGMPAERLVLAEGEPVNGYGRIELYVTGKLFDMLLVRQNRDLCVICCGEDERYYPWRGRRGRR